MNTTAYQDLASAVAKTIELELNNSRLRRRLELFQRACAYISRHAKDLCLRVAALKKENEVYFKALASLNQTAVELLSSNVRITAERDSSRAEHLKTQEELNSLTRHYGEWRGLLDGLVAVLMQHVGETGESEGAVETLNRLVAEREKLKLELSDKRSEVNALRNRNAKLETMIASYRVNRVYGW